MNDPIRQAIYNKKIAPKGKKPNFYSMKEGVEKIRQVTSKRLVVRNNIISVLPYPNFQSYEKLFMMRKMSSRVNL